MTVFNNREIALFLWGAVFLGWCLSQANVRCAILKVLLAAFSKPILRIYAAMGMYMATLLFTLHRIDFWNVNQWKTTIYWTVSVALLSIYRAGDIQDDPHYFKKAIKDNLSVIVVIEFIVNLYTFNIFAELLIVPISAVLGATKGFTSNAPEHGVVDRLIDRIFMVFGSFVLIYAIYRLYSEFEKFATWDTWSDFYLPPLLSLSFLPFVYGLSVLMSYQRSFTTLSLNCRNESLLRYAKRASIIAFNLRTGLMSRWAKSTFYANLDSRCAVRDSIKQMKELSAYEKNPEPVDPKEGWSPYEARDFLREEGLICSHYNHIGGGEWYCSSNNLDLDEHVLPNYLQYTVSGTRRAAKKLRLKLMVHNLETGDEAVHRFHDLGVTLGLKALGGEITNLSELISAKENVETVYSQRQITFVHEPWTRADNGQYDLSLTLS